MDPEDRLRLFETVSNELIETGDVDEHPAWEEVLEWENLEARAATLEHLSNGIES